MVWHKRLEPHSYTAQREGRPHTHNLHFFSNFSQVSKRVCYKDLHLNTPTGLLAANSLSNTWARTVHVDKNIAAGVWPLHCTRRCMPPLLLIIVVVPLGFIMAKVSERLVPERPLLALNDPMFYALLQGPMAQAVLVVEVLVGEVPTPSVIRRANACFMASIMRWVPSVPAAGILRA
jgi:hypothetical protein